jgi:hypothetical protein
MDFKQFFFNFIWNRGLKGAQFQNFADLEGIFNALNSKTREMSKIQ